MLFTIDQNNNVQQQNSGEVKTIRHKLSSLVQGGLKIPIELVVKWQDRKAMDRAEVSYPLVNNNSDKSKDI